jgi:hypothetical protein
MKAENMDRTLSRHGRDAYKLLVWNFKRSGNLEELAEDRIIIRYIAVGY